MHSAAHHDFSLCCPQQPFEHLLQQVLEQLTQQLCQNLNLQLGLQRGLKLRLLENLQLGQA